MTGDNKQRVVVTGMGIISPIGIGVHTFWQSLLEGLDGADEISSFDTQGFRCHKGCEIKKFNLEELCLDDKDYLFGRASQFAIAAGRMAVEDSGILYDHLDRSLAGVSIGTTDGEIQLLENVCDLLHAGFPEDEIDKRLFEYFPCDSVAANLAAYFGLSGPHLLFPNACAAGNYALAYAIEAIKAKKAEVMITGGVDPFSKTAFTGFIRLNAVSADKCRPFDKKRSGILLGEGAGILVLESLESAKRRQTKIYAELLGYGLSCDSYHVTSPDPSGKGMQAAMQKALENANLNTTDVDFICAHGTGTKANDRAEALAIRSLFGDYADQPLVSSNKCMIGHTMGAASAIGAITCAMAVDLDIIPKNINYQTPDPACNLNIVIENTIENEVNVALNNAFAFGGNNSCLILGKFID
jgi:3-oxoacyl-[acyl-carrier-protein] synthase II